jgi:hypothetical protein
MAHPFKHHETAPMIALVWGITLAPIVSALIVDQPDLAPRIVLAPGRVIHSLAAYIHHALDSEHDIEQIGREIAAQDVRVLLSCALTNPHRRLYRMLDRLGPTALDITFYRRLNEVLHGPAADLLLDVDEITETHLRLAIQIIADPVLLAARKAIKWSQIDLQHLQHILKYLRVTGLSDAIEKLPTGGGWKAILRRVNRDLGRARAPRASFAAPPGWRQIEDVAGLWRVGTLLGNCVASFRSGGEGYVEQLVSGDAVYLAHDDVPVMLACVRNVGPNLWVLGETTTARIGSDIMKARDALRTGLTIAIAETGGALLDHSPLSAMQAIAWRTEGGVGEDFEDDVADAAA